MDIVVFYIRKKWEKERAESYYIVESEENRSRRIMRLPKNRRQRRLIIIMIFLIIRHVLQTLLDFYTPLKLIFVKKYEYDLVFNANTTDMIINIIKEIFDSTTNLLLLYVGYRLTITQQQNMRKILRKERNIKGSSDYSD